MVVLVGGARGIEIVLEIIKTSKTGWRFRRPVFILSAAMGKGKLSVLLESGLVH
jgi:hypothetical protein